jgi:hypothetical protein
MRISFAPMLAALLVPALATADPFTDFRIPGHHWRGGEVRLQSQGSSLTNVYASGSDTRELLARLSGHWAQGWESDALRWNVTGDLLGDIESQSMLDANSAYGWPHYERNFTRSRQGGWALGGSVTTYPLAIPLGLQFSGSVLGTHQRRWGVDDRTDGWPPQDGFIGRQEADVRAERLQAGISAMAGAGRVRDVSVVYDAHVLEQRLRDAGVLTRPLSTAGRERLAALLAVTPAFGAAHERPDRFAWREIERVLREDGALGEGGLDARAVMKAREDYRVGVAQRYTGWFVGPQLSAVHDRRSGIATTHAVNRTYFGGSLVSEYESADIQRDRLSDDVLWAGGQAEWHHPLGWDVQLDALVNAEGPVRAGERGLDARSAFGAAWLVAERWSASARVESQRTYFAPRRPGDVLQFDGWAVSWHLEARYHVEDHVSLGLALNETQVRDREWDSFSYRLVPTRDRVRQLLLSVSYSFFRRLDTPGLFGPVLPVR